MQEFILEKREEIAELCRTHHVRRLAVFGSAVRDDFDAARSDVDVLVAFASDASFAYLDNFVSLRTDLQTLLHRQVDLLREGVLTNPYRAKAIEADKVILYAA